MNQKSTLLFTDLEKSVKFLDEVILQPPNDYMRAAAIQAFEICFELSWKYLMARLSEAGIEEPSSPRSTFRESGKAGMLNTVETWLVFAEQRNLTVHTYQEQLADNVYAMIKNDFLSAVQDLLQSAAPSKEI